MKKVKIAFYGGCQLIPVAELIRLEFSDQAVVLNPGLQHNTLWGSVFSPVTATRPELSHEQDLAYLKALHNYLDQADMIVMQPFLKVSNMPIGRNWPKVQEFLHKTIIAKYADKKQIIGANVIHFKGYFLDKIFGHTLLEIIAFLYIQKGLTVPAQILKWLHNETCEEIHKLYLKKLFQSRAVHTYAENALNEDFPTHIQQYNFEDTHLNRLITTAPGHPTIEYYLKVLPDYINTMFNIELKEKDIVKNQYKILEGLHSYGSPYLPDFYFFKNLFPEISSDCFTPDLAFKRTTEGYIDSVLIKINSIGPGNLRGLFTGWADLKD